MRLIDADALWMDVIHSMDYCDDILEMIDSQPTIDQKSQWIPCSERLPDNDDSVLISNKNGVTKAWWTGRSWTSIAVKNYKTVTAWMPLPEPYKGES